MKSTKSKSDFIKEFVKGYLSWSGKLVPIIGFFFICLSPLVFILAVILSLKGESERETNIN